MGANQVLVVMCELECMLVHACAGSNDCELILFPVLS